MFDGVPKEVFSHYKELEAVGLAAPQVTYLMHDLVEKGLSLIHISTDQNAAGQAQGTQTQQPAGQTQ